MSSRFEALWAPTPREIDAVSRCAPYSPFNTASYATACLSEGRKTCVFATWDESELVCACLGFLQTGLFSSHVEIVSAPPAPAQFWQEVHAACRRKGVSDLSIQSFGSEGGEIPQLPGETGRRSRREYVIDLVDAVLFREMSANCRRNISRARKLEITVRRTRDPCASKVHLGAMAASTLRRRARGEDDTDPETGSFAAALLESGAAELFQAVDKETVLSSVLIVRGPISAYYHSAGTTPDGMRKGASALLIGEVATILKDEGLRIFNLGGAAEDAQGLRRFKSGFGAREVILHAATFSLVSPLKRRVTSALRLLRHDPLQFAAVAAGKLVQIEQYVAFSGNPAAIGSRDGIVLDGTSLQPVTNAELGQLSGSGDFQNQAARVQNLGYNAAYGLYYRGALVHVAWLIDSRTDPMNPVRNLLLRAREVEITHCVTAMSFRGRGFYPRAIRHLCRMAAASGAQTVFMITSTTNAASQRGIEKAGLSKCGRIVRLIFPWIPGQASLTWRGHRWSRVWPGMPPERDAQKA